MTTKRRSLSRDEKAFVRTVWAYYKASGRHELPWRKTNDPYAIVVSELMLQQTQVVRVLPKYKEFMKQFPTTRLLAAASLGDVLKAWQGLGYNRRAKFLWQAAGVVMKQYKGKWPRTSSDLRTLPGIGSYTSGAVMSFAYNEPVPLIETNVRTVYLHHFFSGRGNVTDAELLPIVERTLDHENPREWNWALMDYGAHLKVTVGNISQKSRSYKKQRPFKNSDRYVRGAILRALTERSLTLVQLKRILTTIESGRIAPQVEALTKEGLIKSVQGLLQVP